MRYLQFRIHPSVGIARMGDSEDVYYLASDFPQFMQEEFPTLRLKPRPLTMPPVDGVGTPPPAATFKVFDEATAAPKASVNKFKDKANKILPQAARFRVFAYVYDDLRSIDPPIRIFEVTTDHADIEWKVQLGNLKAQKTSGEPLMLVNSTPVTASTSSAKLARVPVKPDAVQVDPSPAAKVARPPLGYAFLERKASDATKLTGRLHLIGNHGETHYFGTGNAGAGDLWKNDWFDSEADGPVTAVITPKGGGAALRQAAGAASASKFSYLEFGTKDPKAAATAAIAAMPAWAVVGLPDYVPDIGHIVSLWDLALGQALQTASNTTVKDDPTHHKIIRTQAETTRYRRWDYRVHIHPQLCIFADVNWVNGATSKPVSSPGHNVRNAEGSAPTSGTDDEVKKIQIERGGVRVKPRSARRDLADPKKLKETDKKKPINDWLKEALFSRLRTPGTLYLTLRNFIQNGSGSEMRIFPRHLGRRWQFTPAKASDPLARQHLSFPNYVWPPGSTSPTATLEKIPGTLRDYHGKIERPHMMCGAGGKPALKSGAGHPAGYDDDQLYKLDDMYWPISVTDMPMLRELAFTHLQHDHFKYWSQVTPAPEEPIFDQIVAKDGFPDAAATDVDDHLAILLQRRPRFVPALIDMANLGSMLGGSFLPGIEVGLEAGRQSNWTLYHGGTEYFPDLRFELATKTDAALQHFAGMLTKDLAIPWQTDYAACTEDFWPTARPGSVRAAAGDSQRRWLIRRGDLSLGSSSADSIAYFDSYWKKLGFIRRKDPVAPTDEPIFLEEEKTP